MKPKKTAPYGNFRHCETQNFRRKILILPYPQTFPLPEFLWNTAQKGSPKKSFGSKTKNFRRKMLIPPSLIQTLSRPENNETQKDSPYEIFRHCETKKFRRKILILPYPQIFSLPELFWNTAQKGSPQKISAPRDKNISRENRKM